METTFKVVFGLLVAGLVATLRVPIRHLRQRPEASVNQMTHELAVLKIVRPVLGLGFYLALLDWLVPGTRMAWATMSIAHSVRWAGAVVVLGALLVLAKSLIALGPTYHGGVGLWDDHRLVTSGPYRYIRHPIYSAFIAIMAGLWALTASWLLGATGLALSLAIPMIRVPLEERQLAERFGAAFRDYASTTARFVPGLF